MARLNNAHLRKSGHGAHIGLFPAGFDEDGLLFCNQNFADYPVCVPDGKFDARTLAPRFMLLSYKKQATASSCLDGHPTELALDENIRDWWCAEGGAGEWFNLDLGKVYSPHSLQLSFAEEGIPVLKKPRAERSGSISAGFRWTDSGSELRTRFLAEYSVDGANWQTLCDCRDAETDNSHPYMLFAEGARARYIRITSAELPYGSRFALSGVRVFGLGDGSLPARAADACVTRYDELTKKAVWAAAAGAVGYNLRYGVAPDKLYSSIQIYEKCEALLTGLNAGEPYWLCVDSFNENGVTAGTAVTLQEAQKGTNEADL